MIIKQCKSCLKDIIYSCEADMNRRNKTGYCRKCYIINCPKGEKSNGWKGGKIISDSGYILIRNTRHPFCNAYGYVREHRLVMEKYLGRFLKPHEIIHHINGDKKDNRIENLQITNQPEHARFHSTKNRKCSLCERKHLARGYCDTHYWVMFLKNHRNHGN